MELAYPTENPRGIAASGRTQPVNFALTHDYNAMRDRLRSALFGLSH